MDEVYVMGLKRQTTVQVINKTTGVKIKSHRPDSRTTSAKEVCVPHSQLHQG